MLSFLKPNKANTIGTALLLAANWAGSYITSLAAPLLMDGGGMAMGRNGTGPIGGAMRSIGSAPAGNFGLLREALNLIVLALLFYVILSFILGKLAKSTTEESSAIKP